MYYILSFSSLVFFKNQDVKCQMSKVNNFTIGCLLIWEFRSFRSSGVTDDTCSRLSLQSLLCNLTF